MRAQLPVKVQEWVDNRCSRLCNVILSAPAGHEKSRHQPVLQPALVVRYSKVGASTGLAEQALGNSPYTVLLA